jgi:hypothetical protein
LLTLYSSIRKRIFKIRQGKVNPNDVINHIGIAYFQLFLTSAVDGDQWTNSSPDLLIFGKYNQCPLTKRLRGYGLGLDDF